MIRLARSFAHDAGFLDDFRPLLDVGADDRGEFLRRVADRGRALGQHLVGEFLRAHDLHDLRMQAVDHLIRAAEEVAARRGLNLTQHMRMSQPSVAMDAVLVEQIEEAIRQAGCKPHRMVSGAGHDAMILAEKVPAAMVFLRTPGGISHSPEEAVEMEDVAKALEAGSRLLELLAGSPALQRRVRRA